MAARPYEISTTQLTLVDTSRPTPESPDGPGSDERTIDVWLHLPDTTGPAPLIVFSHGMAGHPRKFEDLLRRWAAAGYAVAAPAFPLSNDTASGSFTNTHDVKNQPDDVAFVLDELLARSSDASSDLFGRFDPDRMGAAGLSAGGITTYAIAVNEETHDPRFDAAIVMAGVAASDGATFTPADVPVLVLQGDLDPLIAVTDAKASYNLLNTPRYFVTLLGGGHAGPFEDAPDALEAKVPGHDELIAASTLAFWDQHLLGIDTGHDDILAAIDQDGLTEFEFEVD